MVQEGLVDRKNQVVITQPRRVAAMSVAQRVADELVIFYNLIFYNLNLKTVKLNYLQLMTI